MRERTETRRALFHWQNTQSASANVCVYHPVIYLPNPQMCRTAWKLEFLLSSRQ